MEALSNNPAQSHRSRLLFSLNHLRVDWASVSLISSFVTMGVGTRRRANARLIAHR
jgi:hypothetical protein